MRFAGGLRRTPEASPAPAPAGVPTLARARPIPPVTPTKPDAAAAKTALRQAQDSALPLRRASAVSLLRALSFVTVVLLPMVTAAVYFFAVAADQYVAELRFTLSTVDVPRLDALPLAGNPAPSPAALESQILVQYIASRAIVDAIGSSLDLGRLFAPPQADWWSRLPRSAPIEDLVQFWQGQVDPFYDPATGTVTVRVRAFAPADALRLAQAIAAACEKLVNDLSLRARRDALQRAEAELTGAEARLTAVLDDIRRFREREGLVDPAKTAEADNLLATRLHDQLVTANAELATLRSYMANAAPTITVLLAHIRSLEAQQRLLAQQITGPRQGHSPTLAGVLDSYESLQSKQKFAEAAYQLALRGVDEARASADRQHVFIASFIPPSRPQAALYPRRWRSLGVVALMAFALWGIGGLTVQSVRDHLW